MSDDEIKDGLAKCAALLERYQAIAKPIAEALAERKSMAVFGKPRMYRGELGCWEAGMDTICLHVVDSYYKDRGEYSIEEEDAHFKKVADFEEKWQVDGGKPWIGGHY